MAKSVVMTEIQAYRHVQPFLHAVGKGHDNIADISRAMNLSPSAVCRFSQIFEGDGLIAREKIFSPKGHPRLSIGLTELGLDTLATNGQPKAAHATQFVYDAWLREIKARVIRSEG